MSEKNKKNASVETIESNNSQEAVETIESPETLNQEGDASLNAYNAAMIEKEKAQEEEELKTIQQPEQQVQGETIPDAILDLQEQLDKEHVEAELERETEDEKELSNLRTDITNLLDILKKEDLERVFEFIQNGCSATPKADKKDKKYRETVERIEITQQERETVKAAGIAPTALLRWMGKNGFTPARAAMVMDVLEIPVSQSTIECQVRGWESRGKIPVLSEKVDDVMQHFM